MSHIVYTVVTEFDNHEDAIALRDLIRELGFDAAVTYRTLDSGPNTPARDTRLGKLVLRHMTPREGIPPRSFTLEDIASYVEQYDYKGISASAILSVLRAQGDVLRIARGVYRIK